MPSTRAAVAPHALPSAVHSHTRHPDTHVKVQPKAHNRQRKSAKWPKLLDMDTMTKRMEDMLMDAMQNMDFDDMGGGRRGGGGGFGRN